MPLSVNELRAGDRVMLNCPKARARPRRVAQFEAVYTVNQLRERLRVMQGGVLLEGTLIQNAKYGAFLMGAPNGITVDPRRNSRIPFGAAMNDWTVLRLTDEGTLKDDANRTVIIERRLVQV